MADNDKKYLDDTGLLYFWGKLKAKFELKANLKALAYKASASGKVTPTGTVSQPTFTGTAKNVSLNHTHAAQTMSYLNYSEGPDADPWGTSGYFYPVGTVSQPTFTGDEKTVSISITPSGTISTGTGAANYTPAGTVGTPTITVTPSTTQYYEITGVGTLPTHGSDTFTQGSLPTWSASVANETLTFSFGQGTLPTFSSGAFSQGSLPSRQQRTVATGISSASSTQPSFTGTGVQLKFTGSSGSGSTKITPTGTVSQPTFTGAKVESSVSRASYTGNSSYTPSGTVSQPTFTGDEKTVTVS